MSHHHHPLTILTPDEDDNDFRHDENNSIGGNAHIDLDNYIDDKQIMLALLYSCDLGFVEEMGGVF